MLGYRVGCEPVTERYLCQVLQSPLRAEQREVWRGL